jgi:hypothetical protein
MATTVQLTIDCHDPAPLVAFWCLALGYVPQPPPAGFDTWNAWYTSVGVRDDELPVVGDSIDRLIDPDRAGPLIFFRLNPVRLDERSRIHLDLDIAVADDGSRLPFADRHAPVRAKADELVAAGGTILWVSDQPEHERFGITMTDPEGNVFCLR